MYINSVSNKYKTGTCVSAYQINSISRNIGHNVAFKSYLSTSELLNSGYKPLSIENNQILNNTDKFLVDTPEKFIAITNSPDIWNKKIVLSKNIDLKGAAIKPIGNNYKPFKGQFDGNGCEISNFKIIAPDMQNIGLFGKTENARIKSLTIKNAYINGKQQVGGLAGSAINSEIEDILFAGYIEGFKKVGGLIGLGKNNVIEKTGISGTVKTLIDDNDTLFGLKNGKFLSTGICGGLIGSDEASGINNSYSTADLSSNEQTGGLLGYSRNTCINNSTYEGNINCPQKSGGLIGWGENAEFSDCYALCNTNNIVGYDLNCTKSNVYSDIEKIKSVFTSFLDRDIWKASTNKFPRLKIKTKNMPYEKVFLEDLKYNTNHNIIKAELKLDIFPPKHYEENNEMLKKIRESKSPFELRETFASIVLEQRYLKNYNQDDTQKDELLLALVKNPYMDFNKRFDNSYNVWCTPLFILTCLNKAYILQEALKRKDVDPSIKSGYAQDLSIWNQAIKHHIDNCAYVIMQNPRMESFLKEDLPSLKSTNPSPFIKLLLEKYPKIPSIDEKNGNIEFEDTLDNAELIDALKQVNKIEDVQKLPYIDRNYKDSNGNNIVNIAASLDNEEEALRVLIAAKHIGTNTDNWNDNGETPIGHALFTRKAHFVAQLMNSTKTPFMRLADGMDAMLLFSTLENEDGAVNYMEKALKRGLSINSQDINGNTPLINSIENKHHKKLKYLLSKGANPNLYDNFHQTPLHHACINNDEEAVKLLLESYAYPNIKDDLGNLPIDYLDEESKMALKSSFEDKAYLYEISGIKDEHCLSHINFASDEYYCINNSHKLSDFGNAIASGCDIDKNTIQLSKNAVLNTDIKFLKDGEGNNILHLAAISPSFFAKECISNAIEAGIDINAMNYNNETPLMRALDAYLYCSDQEEKINLLQNIKLLLDNNPNVDLADNNKQSALHRICQSGNLILFNEILKLNPKLNQVDTMGKSPFEYIPVEADTPMYMTAEKYLQNNKILKEIK